ncbi:MAG TPA: STAS domain-containing protein [Anaeromyxobacteraceae bacterium]|nr:STAS domain-containing protein [Anaeromyxobacteraceae bacterium]
MRHVESGGWAQAPSAEGGWTVALPETFDRDVARSLGELLACLDAGEKAVVDCSGTRELRSGALLMLAHAVKCAACRVEVVGLAGDESRVLGVLRASGAAPA